MNDELLAMVGLLCAAKADPAVSITAVSATTSYDSWMAEELRRRGYSVSYGTLYPAFTGWKRKGFFRGRTG